MSTEPIPSAHKSLVQDRAIRVFKFLRELATLRSQTIRDSSQYDVWWLSDLPRESGCYFIGWQPVPETDPGTPWVEIRKPKIKPPPMPPANLEPWIIEDQVSDSTIERPRLQEIVEMQPGDGDSTSQLLLLEEHPEISAQWETFLETQWLPWATKDRVQQRIQEKYSTLFSIYQKQKTLGENFEVVVSLGHFSWRTTTYEVARHLITAQASLTFDDVRGIIRVGAAADGAKLALEHDMLDVDDRPPADDIEDQLNDCEFVMWDGQAIPDALRGWVHRLSADGEYNDSITCAAAPGPRPIIILAPAIVMRRRSERTILRLFKDLIAKFESGKQPSTGIEHLVAVIENFVFLSEDGSDPNDSGGSQQSVDLFFPLPANDEQRLIVEKLERSQGVLVQGPPGTGKSHTIANLLCHLLASGKRVLVTSHTARALAVLRDKLPREIADLCVQLLGNDLTALHGLENSIREITERYNDRNEERSAKRIANLEKALHETRQVAARCQQAARSIREADTYVHEAMYGDYCGTTQSIAQQVRERQVSFGWILGLVDEATSIPITDAEATELLDLQLIVDDSMEAESVKERPRIEELPDPRAFAATVQALNETKHRCDALFTADDQGLVSWLKELDDDDDLTSTCSAVSTAARAVTAFDSVDKWLHLCRADIIARNPHTWAALLASTERYLERIGDRAQWASEREVTGIDDLDQLTALVDATALLEHLEKGGGLGFGPFKATVVKQSQRIVRGVRVNGAPCSTQKVVKDLCIFLEVKRDLQNLSKLWAHVVTSPIASIAIQAAYFTALRERLADIMELQQLVEDADATWRALGGTEPLWATAIDLQRVARCFDYACALREWDKAFLPIEALARRLRQFATIPVAHEVTQTLANAVQQLSVDAYANAYMYFTAIEETAAKVRRKEALTQRLSASASNLLKYMTTATDKTQLRQRLACLFAAWQWAQANAWLRRITGPAEKAKLESEIEHCKKAERKYITEIASEKAWAWCFKSMTLEQRRHLVAWQQEIKKLGKGTGKHASRHRQQAREELDGARGAVPAWIMPVYRLADTINVNSDRFDVIIIDEASQSGPDAMFLLEFAKQLIIVGDDKQIKPEVFVNQDIVEKLRRQYIPDVPSSTIIGSADTSFFEIGELLYGARVRLREHFRCMPEIIQFSNNLCYRSEPLIPLRQFGQSRLKPVVSAQHVDAGYQKGRTGHIVNVPEAETIVDFITEALKDCSYTKKTFGVISLLGEDQAKLIEQMLLTRIGPEEMQRRKLVCGDAYAFQGDERDVMLLSMVSAPTDGTHIGVLSKQTDERRFNVAASRAQDQMVLFHTVTLNDLNPNCMRHRLLEYCLNPKVDPLEVAGLKLEELRGLATSNLKRRGRPPDPFDSWFEVDVCIRIMERDYRVVPQYEIAGYYVDLMVEGMNGRIAVECDGDAWHGPEQFDRDMYRQRELERAGLRFFRPRGSEFYRDPGVCLEPLWDALTESVAPTSATPKNDVATRTEQTDTFNQNATTASQNQDNSSSAPLAWQSNVITTMEEPNNISVALHVDGLVNEAEPGSSLPAYCEWPLTPMRDPRSCSADEIISGFIEIVRVEGPVVWSRVYRRYARAAGIQRVGHQLRSTFNRAAALAVRRGVLKQTEDRLGQMCRTAWMPNTPPVVVRQRGPRTADEIPPTEIRAVAERITANNPMSDDQLVKRISEEFVIGRLTISTQDVLRKALKGQRITEGDTTAGR